MVESRDDCCVCASSLSLSADDISCAVLRLIGPTDDCWKTPGILFKYYCNIKKLPCILVSSLTLLTKLCCCIEFVRSVECVVSLLLYLLSGKVFN